MSLFFNNFKKAFCKNGGHSGAATLTAQAPYIAKCRALGMTGAQAGLACAMRYQEHVRAQDWRELSEARK